MPDLRVWRISITLFLAWWAIYVFAFGHWSLVREHLSAAAVMIGGSVVAGSTPMGGGAVSFPILVYGFGESPELPKRLISIGCLQRRRPISQQRRAIQLPPFGRRCRLRYAVVGSVATCLL